MVSVSFSSITTASTFGYWLLAGLLYSLWANATGSMFAALCPTVSVALLLVPVMNIVLNNLAGFLIPRDLIPPYYIWIYWINPSAYFLNGNMKNILSGLEFYCDEGELSTFPFPTDPGYPYANCSMIPPAGKPSNQYISSATLSPTSSHLVLNLRLSCSVHLARYVGTYQDDFASGSCFFCPITNGNQILFSLNGPDYDKWVSIGALVGFFVFSRCMGLLGFTFLRFLSR